MRLAYLVPYAAIMLALTAPISAGAAGEGRHEAMHQSADEPSQYPPIPKPGKKIPIGEGYSFVYGFDKKPKIGTSVLKIEVRDPSGKKDTSLEILGEVDMPSMRGAHSSGRQPFKLSKKGDYLLPVNVVMPGEWEVRIAIFRNGKQIFRGTHLFDV